MWKKALTLILVAVTASLLVVSTVSAQEPSGTDGFLNAQGDGVAVLRGNGSLDLTGSGVLWVRDQEGSATIEVNGYGHKDTYEDGWIQYAGFNGTAFISGKRVQIIISGVNVDLAVVGRGFARLWGHGTYDASTGSGTWNASGPGTIVNMAP